MWTLFLFFKGGRKAFYLFIYLILQRRQRFQLIRQWISRCNIHSWKLVIKVFFFFKVVVVYSKKRESWNVFKNISLTSIFKCLIFLKPGIYPTLRQSLSISYSSHNYLVRISNEMLLPFHRVEAIRMNLKYQLIKVWLEVREFIKSKRSYLQFKNALWDLYLA